MNITEEFYRKAAKDMADRFFEKVNSAFLKSESENERTIVTKLAVAAIEVLNVL